jgi:hypothetical protein
MTSSALQLVLHFQLPRSADSSLANECFYSHCDDAVKGFDSTHFILPNRLWPGHTQKITTATPIPLSTTQKTRVMT